MRLRKTPRTLRMAKAARNRKRQRDGLIGEWDFVPSHTANYIIDTSINAGDIITISDGSGSGKKIVVSDIAVPKNPKRVHPARKRKAKQMIKPFANVAQWISIGSGQSGQIQIEKISETQWKVLGTGIS